MRSRALLVVGLATTSVAASAAGCGGGGDSGGAGSAQDKQAAAQAALAKDKAQIARIVHRTVDQDLCVDFTAEMLDGHSVEDCNGDGTLGVQRNDYRIAAVNVSGNNAQATLALRPNGTRTYRLVRQGGAWKVNELEENFEGKVGDGFLKLGNYSIDGRDVNEHVTVRLLAIKDPATPPPYSSPGPGKRWVRIKMRLHSTGNDDFNFSTGNIKLITCNGGRYESNGYPFEPSLGNGGVDLSHGDTVVGYLGFKVQKNQKVCEIRLADPDISTPIKWRVRRAPSS